MQTQNEYLHVEAWSRNIQANGIGLAWLWSRNMPSKRMPLVCVASKPDVGLELANKHILEVSKFHRGWQAMCITGVLKGGRRPM